jgi:hypothetical protein
MGSSPASSCTEIQCPLWTEVFENAMPAFIFQITGIVSKYVIVDTDRDSIYSIAVPSTGQDVDIFCQYTYCVHTV